MKLRIKRRRISITVFRLFLAFILFFVILSERTDISLYLFSLAAFLSFFEIFIYKKHVSQLRSIVNLLADKFLVNLSAIALYLIGVLPIWVVLVFLGRDLLTIVGGSYLLYKDVRREFKPTHIGKIALFFQIISLFPALLGTVDFILIWTAVSLTGISAIELLFRSEFRLTKRTDINEFFRLSNLIKTADIFTLANVIFGLIAVFFIIQENYNYAVITLFLAVIADFLDGVIAKKLKQQNSFGKELDSLADTISFGVAPAIFGFSLIQTPLAIGAFTFFLFCGVLRLAKYNIMHVKESFEGMPITLNGIIVPVIYLFGVPVDFYPYIYIILGILMISNIRFKKI